MKEERNAYAHTDLGVADPKMIHERLGIPFSNDWTRCIPPVIEDVADAEQIKFGSKTEVIDYMLGYLDKQRHKLHHRAQILQSQFIDNSEFGAIGRDFRSKFDCPDYADSEIKFISQNHNHIFQLCDFASSLHDPNLTNIETLHQLNLNKLRELENKIRCKNPFSLRLDRM